MKKLLIIPVLMVLLLSFTFASYTVDETYTSNINNMVKIYQCTDSSCSYVNLDSTSGPSTSNDVRYTGTASQSNPDWYVKFFYDPNECYLPKTGAAYWYGDGYLDRGNIALNFVKQDAAHCGSNVANIKKSTGDTVQIGQTVTVQADLQSAWDLPSGLPNFVPTELDDMYDSDVDVYFTVYNDDYSKKISESHSFIKIPFNEWKHVSYTFTPTQAGTYHLRIWTKMDNDCKCSGSNLKWQEMTINVPTNRPDICEDLTITDTNLRPGETTKLTLTSSVDVVGFSLAFYNRDNLYSANNPKPIYYPGTQQYIIGKTVSARKTYTFNVPYSDLPSYDNNYGGAYPDSIQINGYLKTTDGKTSAADAACVVYLKQSYCGDSIKNGNEQCDDGNTNNYDSCRNDCSLPKCGDNIVDQGEQCDDGNTNNYDSCRNDCSLPVCGDGHVDAGEQCDDGNTNNYDSCRNDCSLPVCGDGIVDQGEQCDDGNTNNYDSCRNDCSLPVCGDGIVDINEECDDGNSNNYDSCRNDCSLPYCGDLIVDQGEQCEFDSQCDDGNSHTTDFCNAECGCEHNYLPYCGDGHVDAGEQCDDGNSNNYDSCRNDCTAPYCGDGIVDQGEECDDGNSNDNDQCRNDCTVPKECNLVISKTDSQDPVEKGDRFYYTITVKNTGTGDCTGGGVQLWETYPDGLDYAYYKLDNGAAVYDYTDHWNFGTVHPGDSHTIKIYTDVNDDAVCDSNLHNSVKLWSYEKGNQYASEDTKVVCPAYCGDGHVDAGEQCDDGNSNNYDSCRNDCSLPYCGDHIVDQGEQCDDGNSNNYDSCRNDCTLPVCGDGHVDAGEQCDDGNSNNNDSCRNDCSLPVCGDGIVDQGEQCDDGNSQNGDGCSATCGQEECKLKLVKTGSPDPVEPGDVLTYDLTLTNIGTMDCTGGGVQLLEHYDPRTTYIDSDPAPWDPNPNQGDDMWNFGTMHPGDSEHVTVRMRVSEDAKNGDVLENRACYWARELYDYNNDEWDCVTVDTNVIIRCQDECSQGETMCSGDSLYQCGNFDSDSCLEWGSPDNCAYNKTVDSYSTCENEDAVTYNVYEDGFCKDAQGNHDYCDSVQYTEKQNTEDCGTDYQGDNFCQANDVVYGTTDRGCKMQDGQATCYEESDFQFVESCGPDTCTEHTAKDPFKKEYVVDENGCSDENGGHCEEDPGVKEDYCVDDNTVDQAYCAGNDYAYQPFDCSSLSGCYEFPTQTCVTCTDGYGNCKQTLCNTTGVEYRQYNCGSGSCFYTVNWDGHDVDGDQIDDRCDDCIDVDHDGVCDNVDNCVGLNNPTQVDTDNDGIGNACDQDRDGDGYPSSVDCNDWNKDVHPGATEIMNNGIDDDCSDKTPDTVANLVRERLYVDVDYSDESALKYGELDVVVSATNNGEDDLRDMQLAVTFPGMGLHQAKIQRFLNSGDTVARIFRFDLPQGVSGYEYMRVSVSNDDYQRTIYREIKIPQ